MTTIHVEQKIKTNPTQAYLAFTNASVLRSWLCDRASVDPQPGGRMYLWWFSGFFASGEYLFLDTERSVSFKWQARGEPGTTKIDVAIGASGEETLVALEHNIPEGPGWEGIADNAREEWETSLENLANLLETGQDLRLVNRPTIGVITGDISFEQTMKYRIPVQQGLRVDAVLSDSGAELAGLSKDDVLVTLAGKPLTTSPDSLDRALSGKRAGEKVDLTFYRNGDKRQASIELMKRNLPLIPWEPARLAELVKEKYAPILTELNTAFKNASEELSARKPSRLDWSAKEVLAHLIHTERNLHSQMEDAVGGSEKWSDAPGQNSNARIQATMLAYGTTAAMLVEYNRLCTATIAFTGGLQPEFIQRKSAYFKLGMALLQNPIHIDIHLDQIHAALKNQ